MSSTLPKMLPFVTFWIYLYTCLIQPELLWGHFDLFFVTVEAGIFQCNFSSIYSNINLLFKKNYRSLNKWKRKRHRSCSDISVPETHGRAYFIVFITPIFSWPRRRGGLMAATPDVGIPRLEEVKRYSVRQWSSSTSGPRGVSNTTNATLPGTSLQCKQVCLRASHVQLHSVSRSYI